MFADKSDQELFLLRHHGDKFDVTGEASHVLKTAPIITGDAFELMGSANFPQRTLYGSILETSTGARVKSPKLHINTNAPFSGCGVSCHVQCHLSDTLLHVLHVFGGLWEEPFYLCPSGKLGRSSYFSTLPPLPLSTL